MKATTAMKAKCINLVQVSWWDASSNDRWRKRSDVKNDERFVCYTVGWLVHENKTSITVASTISPLDEETLSMTMNIPRGCIKKIVKVQSGPRTDDM